MPCDPPSAPVSEGWYKILSWGKDPVQGLPPLLLHPFPHPHTLPRPPNHQSENSPTTHRSKRMLSFMVDCLQPGSARKVGLSEITLSCAVIFALFSLPLVPQATPSWFPSSHLFARSLMVCHLPSLSICLALLSSGPPTFQPFHLPATLRVTSPTVHRSHRMPHLIPLCQLLRFPCGGGGVEEDKEDRVGHGSNPEGTLCTQMTHN